MKKWYETQGPEQDAVISSCVWLSRNISGIPFPAKLNTMGKQAVVQKLLYAAENEKGLFSHAFVLKNLPELKTAEAVALAERGVIKADFADDREGRFALVSEDESQTIMVNGEDHVLIQVRSPGLSLEKAYADADQLDTILNKTLCFAFHDRLGFLTSNPALLGTGMIVCLDLHLPALRDTGSATRIAANLSMLGITLSSALHPHGSVYRLSNRMTLGITEQEAIDNLNGIAKQIIAQEYDARKKLISNISVQDMIGRAIGIFHTARLLDYHEFLDLASIVRLGIAEGFETNLCVTDIDALTMRLHPANLVLQAGMGLTENEEKAMRAQIVREFFDHAEG
jgi:protein arginine kinase